jgi:hypothetical protein
LPLGALSPLGSEVVAVAPPVPVDASPLLSLPQAESAKEASSRAITSGAFVFDLILPLYPCGGIRNQASSGM